VVERNQKEQMKSKLMNGRGHRLLRCSALLDHTGTPPSPLKEILRAKIAEHKKRAKALQALHDALPEITGELGAAISREIL
jgi:hypothetical protein